MNFKKVKIRTKFSLLIIGVVVYLMAVIGLLMKIRVEDSMTQVFEEQIITDSNLGLSLIDETLPGEWNVKDGELYKGDIKINDNNDILDRIGEVTGGIANLFLDNYTVATNIVVDGERRIGADAASNIAEAVLEKGEVYIGEADSSGNKHLTIYQP